MKNSWNIFLLSCFLTWSMAAMAQTNNGTAPAMKSSTAPAVKNKKTDAAAKKPAAEEFAGEIKTDDRGRQYKMVDGRKVLVDNQGVQSLAVPEQLVAPHKQGDDKK